MGRHPLISRFDLGPSSVRTGLEAWLAEALARARASCRHHLLASRTREKPKARNLQRSYGMIEFDEAPFLGTADPAIERARQAARVSLAGEALGRLRVEAKTRPPRVFTGRIGSSRGWRNMPVVLLNGSVGTLIAAFRGWAAVAWHDPFRIQPNRIDYFLVSELQRFKSPAAVMLGSRKKGVVEKPSEKKARTARSNGRCPPRPGSRPRGRPRQQGPELSVDQTHGVFPGGKGGG